MEALIGARPGSAGVKGDTRYSEQNSFPLLTRDHNIDFPHHPQSSNTFQNKLLYWEIQGTSCVFEKLLEYFMFSTSTKFYFSEV